MTFLTKRIVTEINKQAIYYGDNKKNRIKGNKIKAKKTRIYHNSNSKSKPKNDQKSKGKKSSNQNNFTSKTETKIGTRIRRAAN